LVPMCRTLYEMDHGLAEEVHRAFLELVPKFQRATSHVTFTHGLLNQFQEASVSLAECGLYMGIEVEPHVVEHNPVSQFKSEFAHAFSRMSGLPKADLFRDTIDRIRRNHPDQIRFLEDQGLMDELRAELVVGEDPRPITEADQAFMMQFFEEFINPRYETIDPRIRFDNLIQRHRHNRAVDHLIPHLKSMVGVLGKRMRNKKRASKKYRPKSKKTCLKRHMKWKKSTKRCNKK